MNKIDPDVLTFYKELTKNNNRNWFEHQKERFKKLELGVKKFAENIKLGLDTADNIEKVKLFRIYRDVRFSKDKTPYKTHFGIAFHRKKPEFRGGYYIHISPNNSFIASGFWDPSPSDLLRIRKELEIDAQELIDIIKLVKKFEPDLILAVGGGSIIDYAKIANVVDIKPNLAELIVNYNYPFKKKYTQLTVIPTTAG